MIKSVKIVIVGGLLLIAISSCRSVISTTSTAPNTEIKTKNNLTLADLLKKSPGVHINNGEPTLNGGRPLYVVNGFRKGHDYQTVAESLKIDDIVKVEVVTNPAQTKKYGQHIPHGIILIITR